MKNSNLIKRIIICIIGIPAVLSMIFVFPEHNFIVLSIFLILLCAVGSSEMSRLAFKKYTLPALLSVFACIIKYFQGLSFFSDITSINIYFYYLLFSLILLFAIEIKHGENTNFDSSIEDLSKKIFILIYPGIFLAFIIGMLASETITPYAISFFLILVFSNDIFAYVCGMLFGRKHTNIIKASPKKSLEGFLGGMIFCILTSILCFHFISSLPNTKIYIKVLLGLLISFSANVGDLVESVLKRAAKVKDSGTIMLGRGGVLDCIDSIIISAPFFLIIWNLILSK